MFYDLNDLRHKLLRPISGGAEDVFSVRVVRNSGFKWVQYNFKEQTIHKMFTISPYDWCLLKCTVAVVFS